MVRRHETDPTDRDEQLGEAIEQYLALSESGDVLEPEVFAARYPDLGDDLRAALEGLALVRGLVGEPGESGQRLETGRRIAGYRIVRELGRGGMGVVYEAVHVGLDRPVALKVLGGHAAPDSSGRRRFLNEARTAAGLHHTHIVPVFDVGQVGALCYYAMQRIEGSGLDRVLRHLRRDRTTASGASHGSSSSARSPSRTTATMKAPPKLPAPTPGLASESAAWLDLSQVDRTYTLDLGRDREDDEPPPFQPPRGSAYYRWVAEVGRQSAEALAHAHQRGIIHRDVKPSNLLVDARGTVWMADFGLARRLADPSVTQNDSLLGTPRYMSPEQARIGPIDGRTDVYSLGATLYELLTLRPPFEGRTAAELVEQIGGREPVALRKFDPRLPRDLETIVLKTLAKRPADRYATATDLADDLSRFLHHEPVRARRIGPVGRLWRFARRHPALTGVTTSAAATILAVATVAYVRVVHERDQAIEARSETQAAMRKTEAANQATRAALGKQLWREASVVRLSKMPGRRKTGLDLIEEAVGLNPDPTLRARLRNEAVEFLVIRDIEARPVIPTGRSRRLAFGHEGSRLATLSGDGEVFSLWNFETGKRLESQRLRPAPLKPAQTTQPNPAAGQPTGSTAPTVPGAGVPKGAGRPTMNPYAMAAAGECIAVVLPDGRGIRLFDAATGSPTRDLEISGRRITSLLATPDGHRLVTIESPSPPVMGMSRDRPPRVDEFQVNLYDPAQIDRPLATLDRSEPNQSAGPGPGPAPGGPGSLIVAIGPDGKTVAIARRGKRVVSLFGAEDGQPLGAIETQADLSAMALGPDHVLATAGAGSIALWDIETETPTPLPPLDTHQGNIRFLRFNPSGSLLAAVGGRSAAIEIWDPASHAEVAVVSTPDPVDDLAFSPDGRTLAATSGEAASVWAVVDPIGRTELGGFDQGTSSMAFRGDGLLAMGSWRGALRFCEPGRCLIPVEQDRESATADEVDPRAPLRPTALAFDDRDRLISVDSESLKCCDHPPKCSDAIRADLPRAQRFGMSPKIVRAAGGRTMFLARSSQVLTWNSGEPNRVRTIRLPEIPRTRESEPDRPRGGPGWQDGWRALAASPAGDRVYLLDGAGTVHALTIENGRNARLAWSHPGHATTLAASPDNATLAIGGRQGGVILLDATRGAEIGRLAPPSDESEGGVASLAFAPSGRELAVGAQQGQVEIWSLDNPKDPAIRLHGHRGSVNVLTYDASGRHLASGGSGTLVVIWDLERLRKELGTLGLAW